MENLGPVVRSLEVQHFMGVRKVRIIPTGPVVEIAGVNEAGKTSTIDGLAAVLGGKKMAPDKPLHKGESEGFVEADIGDYILRRTFKTDPDSISGAVKSSLKITAKEKGADRLNQTGLTKLLGGFAFDPLAISRQSPRETIEQLQALAGPDFVAQMKALDQNEQDVVQERLEAGREIKDYGEPDPPEKAAEVDTGALVKQLREAQKYNQAQDDRSRAIEAADKVVEQHKAAVVKLSQELALAGAEVSKAEKHKDSLSTPDLPEPIDALETQLSEAAETNRKAALWNQYQADGEKIRELRSRHAKLDSEIDDLRKMRVKLFADANLPVEGLTFDAEGLKLNDIPMSQLSSAQAWRTWMGIGIASLPPAESGESLRIMFIKDGSLLDPTNFEILRQMAEEHQCQFWVETVGQGHGDAIMIDEGRVVDLEEWKIRHMPGKAEAA